MSVKGEEYEKSDGEDGDWEGFSIDSFTSFGGESDEELERNRIKYGFEGNLCWRLARRSAMILAAPRDLGLWMCMCLCV